MERNDVIVNNLIKKYGKKVFYPKNHQLLFPGDNKKTLYYIFKGRVNLSSISPNGEIKLIYFMGPDSYICELDYFLDCNSTLVVTMEEDSELFELDFQQYDFLWKNYPDFRFSICVSLSKKVRMLQQEISQLSFESVHYRLLRYLYKIHDNKADDTSEWVPLRYQNTQTELAEIIGCSRATINREISNLCNLGYIRKLNNRIEVNPRKISDLITT